MRNVHTTDCTPRWIFPFSWPLAATRKQIRYVSCCWDDLGVTVFDYQDLGNWLWEYPDATIRDGCHELKPFCSLFACWLALPCSCRSCCAEFWLVMCWSVTCCAALWSAVLTCAVLCCNVLCCDMLCSPVTCCADRWRAVLAQIWRPVPSRERPVTRLTAAWTVRSWLRRLAAGQVRVIIQRFSVSR